ncbi:MAG: histidine--tRNA ligase [Methanocellales archaeon]|nr:histidine--tRNA ligase [Methanocellales archaeon]
MKIQKPRGTRDFLPAEMTKRRFIENKMRQTVENWGYQEVQTPIFEHLELFTIKSGETIVNEIYDFEDKGGRALALRPELTASVLRMYVDELQVAPKPLKLYYFGNCFRYERPQKGRFREFWHFGAELIGSDRPEADAEVIALASSVLDVIDLKGDLRIGELSTLRSLMGSLDVEIQSMIMKYIDKKDAQGLAGLLEQVGAHDIKEPLLNLISLKGEGAISKAREIVGDLPGMGHLESVLDMLNTLGIDYSIDFGIARGLDYYTDMVFEIYAENLGAQNQICGGGAYRLAHLFGGRDVSSTGFAIGFDRVIEALGAIRVPTQKTVVVVSTDKTISEAQKIAQRLREHVPTNVDLMGRNFTAQLSHADAIGAAYAVIIGPKELRTGKVTLKNMETAEQEMLTLDEVIQRITY